MNLRPLTPWLRWTKVPHGIFHTTWNFPYPMEFLLPPDIFHGVWKIPWMSWIITSMDISMPHGKIHDTLPCLPVPSSPLPSLSSDTGYAESRPHGTNRERSVRAAGPAGEGRRGGEGRARAHIYIYTPANLNSYCSRNKPNEWMNE